MSFPERNDSQEHAELSIDGIDCEVVQLAGEEALSTLFRYEAAVSREQGGPVPAELLGRDAAIVLSDAYTGERAIQGIVAEARTSVTPDGMDLLHVVIRPAAFRLTLGRDSRVFHDASAADIIQRVLARGRVKARWELTRDYATRVYTAQYREPDWQFISRLCEEEGIYYWFDHEDGPSLLVFADNSGSAPDLAGGARIRFVEPSEMKAPVETIEQLGPAAQVTSSRFALRSFDPARPSFGLEAAAGGGPFEVYDAPGGTTTNPAVLAARAATMNEAAAAARCTMSGKTTSIRLTPGRVLETLGHPEPRFATRLLVTSVSLRITQRRRGGPRAELTPLRRKFLEWIAHRAVQPAGELVLPRAAQASSEQDDRLLVRFRALDARISFRPPIVTPAPLQAGLQSAVIAGPAGAEIYPDEAGRVRAQLHWDREGSRDDASGKWMRVAQRGTAGSMLLPRMGWNVLTTNEEGSVDAPMVMSRIFDAEHPPPYALPENMTRTAFKTATTPGGGSFNEICYEDKAGAEEMFIHASRDMNILAQNAKTEGIQSHALRRVGVDCSLEVGGNSDETIGKNQTITIGGNETESVAGSRVKEVGKAEASTIGGSRNLKAGGANETSVTATRSLSVGAAQIDVSLGDIDARTSMLNVLVGGAVIRLTPRSIEEHVGGTVSASTVGNAIGGVAAQAASFVSVSAGAGGVVQTIGGAKIELAGKSRTVVATKSYKEMVGGAMFLTADGAFTDEATGISTITVAGTLKAKGEVFVFTGGERITLECKGSKLSVTDKLVHITGLKLDLDGKTIDAKAPKLQFNL